MRFSLACISDTGRVRKHNEDNFFFFGNIMPAEHQSSLLYTVDVPDDHAFVTAVFDGMGGEAAGEIASYAAASALGSPASVIGQDLRSVRAPFARMEEAVCDEKRRRRASSMGTTATVLACCGRQAWIANVGDSPALLLSGEGLQLVSKIHTDAETLRELGIKGRKPGLTQYIGMSVEGVSPDPHVYRWLVQSGDVLLVSSDGLTDMVQKDEIAEVLSSRSSAGEKAVALRNAALSNGGADNVTMIVCEALGDETCENELPDGD